MSSQPIASRVHMLAIVAMCIAIMISAPAMAQTEEFNLDWNTIDCGGGEAGIDLGEETWSLDGTIGQFDAGFMSTPEGVTGEDAFTLEGGFWPAGTPSDCRANIARAGSSANAVDVDDMLVVLGAWGACPPAPCPANIATGTGSESVVNIDDLLAVMAAWGPCPSAGE